MESRLGREQAHGSPGGPRSLAPEDFEVPADGAGQTAEQIFDSLVGCDEVRELVKGLRSTILYAKASGDDPKTKIEYNYLLVGNPGTGAAQHSTRDSSRIPNSGRRLNAHGRASL